MAKSFFEKLKKGMGIELPVEGELEEQEVEVREIEIENQDEEKEERIIKKTKKKAIRKKPKKKTVAEKPQVKTKKLGMKAKLVKPKISKKEILKTTDAPEQKEDWLVPEGQLSIDVYQTKSELIIQSAIAGIRSEELDIVLESDVITIRGNRKKPIEEQGDYFTKECYWGIFSREIILPVEVDPNRAKASMKEGILVIRIPKIFREKKRKISVKKIGE